MGKKKVEPLEEFFKKKELVVLVDALARRYHRLPTEILTQLTISEFSFNIAVMTVGNLEESRASKKEKPATKDDLSKFKIKRTVVKKAKVKGKGK
ncbi:hypothetical protein ACFL2J_05605 [Candidatus Omnitrophota bacterium]